METLYRKGVLTDEEYEDLRERERATDKVVDFLGGIRIGVLTFLDYSVGRHEDDRDYNRFTITRGYLDVRKRLTSWLGVRVTPDVHQEAKGDFKLRLKYLYAEFRPPDLWLFTGMKAEVGMGHMPWLDCEEHINPYRAQGTMFLERAGIFNSSDLGLSIRGNLGGSLDTARRPWLGRAYAGRYGSWHVGVFNGGGYHASEDNENKVPEWRLSLRPLPGLLPGLQVHYFGLYGKGNEEYEGHSPDYRVHLGMVSYQNGWIVMTGQFARTWGNNSGRLVVPGTDEALRGEGYSFFLDTRLPLLERTLHLFSRYDHFDPDRKDMVTSGHDAYDLVMGGVAWEFYGHCIWLLTYERTFYERNSGGVGKVPEADRDLADDWRVQTVLQIKI